ncbi:MAG: hypothetical protein M3430_19515 [Acidobacteriota bacterium]|nr:hypothetical protein [Acidobacteriota bacterium]
MTTFTFKLPDNLRLSVTRTGASFTAYLLDLPAHISFVFPLQAGHKLLEAFELNFLDAGIQVTGEFSLNNSFVVSEWQTLPLNRLTQS